MLNLGGAVEEFRADVRISTSNNHPTICSLKGEKRARDEVKQLVAC